MKHWSNEQRRAMSAKQRKHTLNESAFDLLTDEAAYWLGFLIADGCVIHRKQSAPELVLNLNKDDEAHLKTFRKFLGASHKIARTQRQKLTLNGKEYECKEQRRVAIRSYRLTSKLAEYGIVSNKSLTANASSVLSKNPHFWRGVIDGDGSLFWQENKPVIALCGSLPLMQQFSEFIHDIAPACLAKVTPHKRIFSVRVAGLYAIQIIKLLYEVCPIALPRKHKKAIELLAQYDARRKRTTRLISTEEIIALYEQGYSVLDISKLAGIGDVQVYRILKSHGIERRTRSEALRLAYARNKR